jgi:hypothetical protein
MATNIFRKGYQWPFHAARMLDFGSSLVDLAIHCETSHGRTVFMDFSRNPLAVPGDRPFSLGDCDDDVRSYLARSEAVLASPIERLQKMNPLAIELYRMHGHDITRDPLPFNVNNQHMNGGIAVDIWSESSLRDCYAVGEASGTHGVTRPGGAALNAGQVAAMRCAQQIHSRRHPMPEPTLGSCAKGQIASALALVHCALNGGGPHAQEPANVKRAIQARMSDHGGFICAAAEVGSALIAATTLREQIWADGLLCKRESHIVDVFRCRHLALASEAVLRAVSHHLERGGGSRGARAYCSPEGSLVPRGRHGDLHQFRFLAEEASHRRDKLVLRWTGDGFHEELRQLRRVDDLKTIFFEKDWGSYLTGAVFRPGYLHH